MLIIINAFLGSNLKFKLTEFGTLEIVSTVETENGEYEWSTPTQHRKTSENENSKKEKKSPSRGNLRESPPLIFQVLFCFLKQMVTWATPKKRTKTIAS